jgi:TrmH family RNA methyltransferase
MSISIVLEHTSHPGNIGAVARAMYTMGLKNLILINPCEVNEEAFLRARNGREILEKAVVSKDISILEDFHILYGTTSRHRSLNLPVYSSTCISQIIKPYLHQKQAILFGNEKHGLSNELLHLCQAIIEIPAEAGCSLNLSHAVQIIGYELRKKAELDSDTTYSTLKERQHFIQWLENNYEDSNFLLPHTLTRMQNIINKAMLTPEELKLLYSLISAKISKDKSS